MSPCDAHLANLWAHHPVLQAKKVGQLSVSLILLNRHIDTRRRRMTLEKCSVLFNGRDQVHASYRHAMQQQIPKGSQSMEQIPVDFHSKQRSGPANIIFDAHLLRCIKEIPPHTEPFNPKIRMMECDQQCELSTGRSSSHFRIAWGRILERIRGRSSK